MITIIIRKRRSSRGSRRRILWERAIHIAPISLCHDRRTGSTDAILWL